MQALEPSPPRLMDTQPPAAQQMIFSRSGSGWAMLDRYPRRMRIPTTTTSGDDDDPLMAVADTSAGERVRFTLRASPPPRFSRLYFDWQLRNRRLFFREGPKVVAAHRSCILLRLAFSTGARFHEDYFVYQIQIHPQAEPQARATLARLPTCSRIGCQVLPREVGILFRDDDGSDTGFVVACLARLNRRDDKHKQRQQLVTTAQLCMLSQGSGSGSWVHKTLPVRHGEDLLGWHTDYAVPCGDSQLCWVDLLRGILLLCDVFSPDPELRYIPLPLDPPHKGVGLPDDVSRIRAMDMHRSVCATSDGVISFVDVAIRDWWFPTSMNKHYDADDSLPPFAIYRWILKSKDEPKWDVEWSIEAKPFLQLMGAVGIPRSAEPGQPLVDIKDPNIIYLVLREPGDNAFLVAINVLKNTVDYSSPVQSMSRLPNQPEEQKLRSSSLYGGGCASSRTSARDDDTDTASCNITFCEPFVPCEFSKYLVDAPHNQVASAATVVS